MTQTTQPETTTPKSMTALADILRQNGIKVGQICEVGSDPMFYNGSEIVVGTDKDLALKAADIALELGYPLVFLECDLMVFNGKLSREELWVLVFRYPGRSKTYPDTHVLDGGNCDNIGRV